MEGTPLNNWKVERTPASEILRSDAYEIATMNVKFIGNPYTAAHAISPPPWSTSHRARWVYSMPSAPEMHSQQRARCTRTGRFMSWQDSMSCPPAVINTVVWVRPCWKGRRHIGGQFEIVMMVGADGDTAYPRISHRTFGSLEEAAAAALPTVVSYGHARGYTVGH